MVSSELLVVEEIQLGPKMNRGEYTCLPQSTTLWHSDISENYIALHYQLHCVTLPIVSRYVTGCIILHYRLHDVTLPIALRYITRCITLHYPLTTISSLQHFQHSAC